MITDKVGGSSAKPEVSKQSKEKRLKHKVSGYKSQSKRRSIAGCRLLLRTLLINLCQNSFRKLNIHGNVNIANGQGTLHSPTSASCQNLILFQTCCEAMGRRNTASDNFITCSTFTGPCIIFMTSSHTFDCQNSS